MQRAHVRRNAGVAALLPALFLAALYIAAPFAGTTTHAIAHTTPTGSAHSEAVHAHIANGALHTAWWWYAAIVLIALAVVALVAAPRVVTTRRGRRTAAWFGRPVGRPVRRPVGRPGASRPHAPHAEARR